MSPARAPHAHAHVLPFRPRPPLGFRIVQWVDVFLRAAFFWFKVGLAAVALMVLTTSLLLLVVAFVVAPLRSAFGLPEPPP